MNRAKHEVGRQGAAVNERLADAAHLPAIEGNPLSPDELAMFEMFEREGWPARAPWTSGQPLRA